MPRQNAKPSQCLVQEKRVKRELLNLPLEQECQGTADGADPVAVDAPFGDDLAGEEEDESLDEEGDGDGAEEAGDAAGEDGEDDEKVSPGDIFSGAPKGMAGSKLRTWRTDALVKRCTA